MLDCPNTCKGHLYSSNRVSRCPLMHLCIATSKCQNYDSHNAVCNQCESRGPRPPVAKLGGLYFESDNAPDIQESIKILQDSRQQRISDPDAEKSMINGRNITNKYDKERRAAEMLSELYKERSVEFTEKDIYSVSSNDNIVSNLGV